LNIIFPSTQQVTRIKDLTDRLQCSACQLTVSAEGLPAGTSSVLVEGESSIVCEGFSSCFFQFGLFLADFPLTNE
jgi:hypothetical protein